MPTIGTRTSAHAEASVSASARGGRVSGEPPHAPLRQAIKVGLL